MPLTKEQEEKPGWEQRFDSFFEVRQRGNEGSYRAPDVFTIKNFIRYAINEALEAQRKEIVEGIKLESFRDEHKLDVQRCPVHMIAERGMYNAGLKRAFSTILSLPQLQVNAETDETK